MNVELLIEYNAKIYLPIVLEEIEWSTERRSIPGKLTFKVAEDSIGFQEGAVVQLKVDKAPVFFGFIFKKRRSKDQIITITAYDQLRYLTNKDTYVYKNMTASQLIRKIAANFSLNIGVLEDTKFIIASRVEENTGLFDMVENALDLTLQNKRQMYVLYDDFGKLALKNIASMRVGYPNSCLVIDAETGEDFEYTSSIDNNTYNKIKLTYDNEKTYKRDVYIAQDSNHMREWGILQYFDTLSEGENGKVKTDALLKLYNSKTRNLKITNVFGDIRVRAGSLILVVLDLGDVKLKNFMLVEKCRHIFKLNTHFMDLTLQGGEFVA